MHTLKIFSTVIGCGFLLTVSASAQDTNAPRTHLEFFETRTGLVIVRGSADIGAVQATTGAILVTCRESTEAVSGRKQDGVAVSISVPNLPVDTTVIDYDEMNALLGGLDYLSKANWSSSRLPGFDAVYTTRGGLQLAAYSSRKQPGTIGMSLKSSTANKVRISLTSAEFAQLYNLILQAKTKLDSLQAGG